MKIIAFYLPQFHKIPENDEWWGKGFTEWVNVKKAKPLFDGHYQPRIPLNNNYYNLLDDNVMKWQVDLAKKYSIYGFCFYHYWFNGHMLLEKPMENMLNNEKINFPYCICWANEPWTNAWKSDGNTRVLIEQRYGREAEWENHFIYLLQFFKDKNYIVEDNKPLFVIYRPEIIDCLNEMLSYWDKLAKQNGFDGIKFAYQQVSYYTKKDKDESLFDYRIEYQPGYARYDFQKNRNNLSGFLIDLKTTIRNKISLLDKKYGTNLNGKLTKQTISFENYDDLCNEIIQRKADDDKSIAGMFVGWDNTPRRPQNGRICLDSTPEKFYYYLDKQVKNVRNNYSNDYLFIFAWNEWAEGGYLEPDEKNKFKYLSAIHDVLSKNENR